MNLSLLSRYASAFVSYWIGKIHLRYPPLFYSIEVTNICNYRCSYCPQGTPQGEDFRKGRMSQELFEHILKQIGLLKPVSQVYLTGSGEPLMHPHLERFISLANEYGFVPNFSSNGSLFTEERSKSLLNSGRFSLTVDFSPNRKIYESYRSGGVWETVYSNLKSLLLLKKKSKGNYPKIEIRDMSTVGLNSPPDWEGSLSDLKRLFNNLPVDRFSQLKVHTWSGNVDPQITPARVKGKRYKLCMHPWSIFVITYSGKVLACCRDFGSEYVIGRMDGEEGILDIWNNQIIKSLRRALVDKKPHDISVCKNCDRPLTGGSVARSKPQMIKKILWEKIVTPR